MQQPECCVCGTGANLKNPSPQTRRTPNHRNEMVCVKFRVNLVVSKRYDCDSLPYSVDCYLLRAWCHDMVQYEDTSPLHPHLYAGQQNGGPCQVWIQSRFGTGERMFWDTIFPCQLASCIAGVEQAMKSGRANKFGRNSSAAPTIPVCPSPLIGGGVRGAQAPQ